jgi:outer membrane protein OmpA-like peptidoglycan-associated protein
MGTIERKANEKTQEELDKALEDEEKAKQEEAAKKETKTTEETSTPAATTAQTAPTFKSYSKFDFIPGENVLFFDDFSQDAVGDFPAKWNTSGSGEVVTINSIPGNWLKIDKLSSFGPSVKIAYPENFTIEYDFIMGDNDEKVFGGFTTHLISLENQDDIKNNEGNGAVYIHLYNKTYDASNWSPTANITFDQQSLDGMDDQYGKKMKVSIWVQKQRVRLYFNERKVYDLPKAIPSGVIINYFKLSSIWEQVKYFSNFRIAAGAPDMRSKLMTEGKLVTHGILFDVNSDKIKAESYGTLKEIAKVLTENAGVRVKIIGHTDSDGDDAKNLELSKKRAASVKDALSKEFAIDAGRLDTDGKGETQPAAPNTTPEGKANNRRVEFVKL